MTTIHPAKITKVLTESIAAEIGFEAGDAIVAINGTQPRDLIDYQFLCADEVLELEVLDTAGKTHHIEIEKDYDDDLGLEFETALFDGLIQCNNRCPFCFIDQQPPGKRSSLYFKDDDYRLSFLYGSYLTLTNLSEKEWQRIEQMRLSPLYVSVHATEPEIRTRLLKNNRAGQILKQLKWFQERRLQIHAQVVVCPGINDGKHLEQTLRDLTSFHTGEIPAVASIAVVPVGLTRFRPQEDELVPVTQEKAREVISQVKSLSHEFRKKFGSSVAWLADEWFLIAGEELPSEAEYEEYPQIDNGVGSIRLFIKQFTQAAHELLPLKVSPQKKLTWVVGNAVEQAFKPIVKQLNAVEGLEINMKALCSDYWGQSISVTGLLTGHDLLLKLNGQDLGEGILLPSVMLKHGELIFLDDVSVENVANQLNTKIFPVAGVEDLINTCIS
ncbi:TIGR03279 family radical SAM protein [Anabaena cylindrica FACHB-243]|uniref:FeS-containing oxidoreductase n=1 Tax=Anabaena cylindrica (strain ATCC 27899 / PCC 7122) TaxID=272123 RepID=K9ZPH5_ANACC|nr:MULTISPECIES: TIGR03279 family radical SAM protein [Anabaena]AFZ60215.1 FeS-containing oxidoreductase [Anabaena cylindrica PCC 7122]MBD2417732.1 TIGR03279 family radical SAM protein [Anabaena cylindrica FACHB-243]MBY5281309.1 TIGR03279 family radical SAM protein [Anabaena sp. CCAP 1446/1C]MBY5306878.1 TIGR03279 family radical SAM protein [Anabaena sp. CCAP 1446/1C]MCM2404647.1 TIGR03279 family radical SAM protein [Anabaena sp. CCAP 1446/1C]